MKYESRLTKPECLKYKFYLLIISGLRKKLLLPDFFGLLKSCSGINDQIL